MRATRRIHPTALTAALLSLFVAAAAPCAAEWRRIDSPNFVVIGDVSAGTLRDVAVKFEGFRETLSRVLTARATATPVPTIVIVFPSDKAFTPFKPTYNGKPVPISGMFQQGRDANYIAVVPGGGAEGFRVVFHEYAHLVVSNVIRNAPVWLSEGLAEFYSTYEIGAGGREALIGRPVVHHLEELASGTLLKLDDLLAADRSSSLYNERTRQSVFYAQSWALTHRILLGEPRRTTELAAYVQGLSDGQAPMEAWRQAFGAANMDRELRDYIQNRTFRGVQYKFPDRLAKFEPTASAVPAADADAFLAGFLIEQRRHDEAAARLAQAARLEPDNTRVKLTLGLLDVSRGQHENGLKQLMAIGDPTDWLSAYLAAVGIAATIVESPGSAESEHFDAVHRLVDAAGKNHPAMPNALARLAMIELRSAEGATSQTRTTIERARMMAPGREDYAFVHAQILAHLSDFGSARNVAGPLMSPGYPSEVRDAARDLMKDIVRMESAAESRNAAAAAKDAAQQQSETPPDPNRDPIPVFRGVKPGEQRAEGTLERIECLARGAAIFHLQTADGAWTATAPRMNDVDFITYREGFGGTVACGSLKPPLPVYLTWRTAPDKPDVKVTIAVEFLPK